MGNSAALILTAACCAWSCAKPGKPTFQLRYDGAVAKSFTQMREWPTDSVEVSLLNFADTIVALHDPFIMSELWLSDLGPSGLEYKSQDLVRHGDMLHMFVFEHNDIYYGFGKKEGSIYALQSDDLRNWTWLNGGEPVLSRDPASIYNNLWNVGVTVDDQGLWHLLVECGTDVGQSDVGLAYSTAELVGETLNFDAERSAGHVITGGGNPELKFIAGMGLLSIHGISHSEPVWFISASILPLGATEWSTLPDAFKLGVPGIHVGDPSLVELTDGSTLLSVSVNQNATYLSTSPVSISGLYEMLDAAQQ